MVSDALLLAFLRMVSSSRLPQAYSKRQAAQEFFQALLAVSLLLFHWPKQVVYSSAEWVCMGRLLMQVDIVPCALVIFGVFLVFFFNLCREGELAKISKLAVIRLSPHGLSLLPHVW